ncbi:MAG TPA: protoporphyrinogen oxidase [Lacunisphaera sp.]|nr:protoporphyrinogen oxidase [Lacunisphaera sp.]
MSTPKHIAIVGAGITGLTAAYRLHEQGHRVTVLERSNQLGGSIRTVAENGWLVEAGPNSLQFGAPAVKKLVSDLGLDSEVVPANPQAKRRFVVRGGQFVAVPSSPPALLGSPLFGLRTKLSLLTEVFTRPRVRTSDISLAELVRSHFTQELVDYAVNPLVAGIYAGDPEKLSVRHAFPMLWQAERSHGSVIRGMMAAAKAKKAAGESAVGPIVSFRRGMQTLPATLAARLPAGSLRLGANVQTLLPGQPHRVLWQQDGQATTGEFDAVILAVPAGALAQLTRGTLGERPLASLDNVPHPPVASLFLGYRREQVSHPLDGFGGLVPAVERREVLGILFSSTLFPGRAPNGHVGLTIFAGGSRQPDLARLAPDQLLARIDRDLRELVGVNGEPVYLRHHTWPRAIPQYVLGYERWQDQVAALENAQAGLFIGGNARDGISVPDCVKSGEKLATRVTAK